MDAAIIGRIALETAIPESSVAAVAALFELGATGPFIVHYRKEATGGLDEFKIRSIQERIAYYKEIWDQRAALIKLLTEQDNLTDDLRTRIEGSFSKAELDDLYHQFRPRRKTRATEAAEKGLTPLAQYFWNQELDAWSVEEHIDVFVDPAKGVATREQALQGVVDIIAEWIWANIEYRKTLRDMLWKEGALVSSVVPAKVGQKTKYNMYYERRESVTTIPSHRVLAIRRGCKEGILISSIEGDNAKALDFLLASVIKDKESIFAPVLEAAARESYNRLLRPLIETEVRTQLKERADREAIKVFQENLANLLLSPPAGPIVVMGIDWGKGDECSVAVVNESGQFLEGAKIRFVSASPSQPQKGSQGSKTKTPDAESGTAAASLTAESDTIAKEEPKESPAAEEVSPEETAAPIEEAAEKDSELQDETAPPEPGHSLPLESAPAPESVSAEAPPAIPVELETPEAESPSDSAKITDDPGLESLNASGPDAERPDSALPAAEAEEGGSLPAESAAAAEAPEAQVPEALEKASDPASQVEEARTILRSLIKKHNVRAISIGTGAGARELEVSLRQMAQDEGFADVMIASVNDAGIAIYSSSRIARDEFPDSNASARCAVSLARRLQDPLAELVKIDPKLIGVGQYQHDVDQKELHRGLLQTVQYCVNKVGVNLNTACESLLRYVSGFNDKIARRIVAYRNAHGSFKSRSSLVSAAGVDDFTFQQSAAFLRIPGAENALDRTAVHPESYLIVEKMAAALGVGVNELVGNQEQISALKLEDFVTETAGLPTLNDIREELLRPGRDPRKSFKVPKFRADVKELSDLKPGMALEGIVTNVTNFGAFVDIGVRQDGLVHLSQMSNRFIRDPREAVKVGDVVQVKVISIEQETKRIGLSMKSLLPNSQRRHKKQKRRSSKSPASFSQRGGKSSEGGDPAGDVSVPASNDGASAHAQPGSNRPRRGYPRNRRKGMRKPGQTEPSQGRTESSPGTPEPTLQEKIAILQSKFRRIE